MAEKESGWTLMQDHAVEVFGNRKCDNSLIYKCVKCGKLGLGLLEPCGPPSGLRGRRKKAANV